MNFTLEAIEQGRKRLEEILNREIPLTQKRKKEIIIFWNNEDILWDNEDSFSEKQDSPEKIASSRLKTEKDLKKSGYLMCVRLNVEEVIGRGEHQLTIDVGNALVAKMNYEMGLSRRERTVQVARKPFSFMYNTREELVRLGLQMPPIQFFSVNWKRDRIRVTPDVDYSSFGDSERALYGLVNGGNLKREPYVRERRPCVYLTPDLREDGKYVVIDYNREAAKKLINGSALVEEFEQRTASLLQLYHNYIENIKNLNSGRTYLTFEPHKQNPHVRNPAKKAIDKMFFLQVPVDATQPGKLIVGDIDQVYVFR